MIARVVVIPAAGATGVLDYAVEAGMEPVVRPGVRVLVPLGARRAVGIVTELAATSSHPRLKNILTALDTEPLLDTSLMQLCRWLADYYLCSLSEAVSTALPGSVRIRIERVVKAMQPLSAGGDNGAMAPLPDAAARLLEWLTTGGPQTTRAIEDKLGVAARAALATLRRRGCVVVEEAVRGGHAPTKHQRYFRIVRELAADEARQWRRKRPAQYALYAYLHAHPLRRARATELKATFPNAAAKLGALIKAGCAEVVEEEVYRPVLPPAAGEDRPVDLSTAQYAAVQAVIGGLGAFRTYLLWGVTGSGKTEVYLHAIAACLAAQRTALVLVPEISLTHQLVDRVRARFGERVAVLHSGLSDGERWDEWRRIARGEVPIVVGARSAVFAPLPRLGLVVVDEEHDAAFKQEDGIRYNGRDLAVMRAKLAGCPAVLGSATPAVETFCNGQSGRYQMLTLPQRVEARQLPAVNIVDLRRGPALGKLVLISPRLIAALKANLAAHGQSLIFLNRRGFANFLQCLQCGEALMCPNCSVTLTLHRRMRALRCHHCDYTIPPPAACPGCGGLSLSAWGAGTEQVEAALRQLLPGARIGRMDRDTTSRKGSQREIFAAWERREYDVLIGTQMITKGHDVPGVTLVGVLLADGSLNFPDFRAAERTFQLLTQVAGRAGRGARPGRVIIQTLQPEHLSLRCAAQHDYRTFVEHELAARRELGYPPFARLVQIRCEGENPQATERIVRAVATHVQGVREKGVEVLGPTPAPIERLRRRHRWQLLIRGRASAAVRRAARSGRDAVHRQARTAGVRVLVDVDPYGML
ncbi:MAG TPA: primosomal protein N' [Candidatus Margulisiibacteriota bacterium]|nr:primosomal protein N' [Candidatus Margulisiibacteriota bacterium]